MRHLHLYLVTDTGFGITPIVGRNESARSGRRDYSRAYIIRGCPELASQHPVHVNVYCWIAQRLFEFDISQFFYFCEFLLNTIRIALHVGILRPGNGHFRG